MRRAAADGVDVMLDGEGGDELFGCARYLVADRLRSGGPAAGLRIARRLPGMGARPRARWLARALLTYGVRGALPPALHEPLRSARGRSGGPAWLAEPLDHDERWSWKRLDGPRWWAQLAHMLTADSLGAVDHHRRSGVLDGVELRHPLYDPELVDLVLSLPPELGFDPVLDRPLARRALARDLPADFLATVDKPFFGELLGGALARDPDRHAVRELLARPHPGLARHLRAGALASGGEPAGGDGAPSPLGAPALWRVAVLELWLRHGGGSD
jgi:asparagine synthetase B (glutamine-hydrolysing)